MPQKMTSQEVQKASGGKSRRGGCGRSSSVEQGKKAGAIHSVKGKVSSIIDTEILKRVILSDRELRGSNRISNAERNKKASSYEWFGELAVDLQDIVSLVP